MGVIAGLLLAFAASTAQNTGFLFEHIDAAARPAVSVRHPARTLGSFARSRSWLLGATLGVAAFLLHALALSLAPLSLVQAFFAGGLALTVPIAAHKFTHRLSRRERKSVVVMALALATLPIGLVNRPESHHVANGRLAAYLITVAALGAAGAFRARGSPHAAGLALAAGASYGILDTAIKAHTNLVHMNVGDALWLSPWWAIAALSALAALLLFQRTLQTHRPVPAIALTEASAAIVSIVAAFVGFDDSLGPSVPLTAIHLGAFAAIATTTWTLAPAAHLHPRQR